MTAWTCTRCTYRHEAKESAYLNCAICTAPKATKQGSVQTGKRQGTLLSHFSSQSAAKRQINKSSSRKLPSESSENPPLRSVFDALKPCRASSFAPQARCREGPKLPWRNIEYHVIPKLAPMTVILDVLPSSVASKLLDQLEAKSVTWNRGNWIIHGKEHKIPRTTATYNLSADLDQNGPIRYGDEPHFGMEDDEDDEYADQKRSIFPELRQAADRIAELVQSHCPWAVANENQNWEPTFAFANRYANGHECVGWHADHITPLGPRPIIVGLSLGACRRFDLRQQPTKDGSCRHVSVPLPHNSVCIMWNDAQERWQHTVPKCSDDSQSMVQHPRVGSLRISLTFRRRRQLPDFGNCNCGRPAGLKAKDGKYYLFCRPYGKVKSKTCMFWKPCPWAEEEAKRLTRLEVATNSASKELGR